MGVDVFCQAQDMLSGARAVGTLLRLGGNARVKGGDQDRQRSSAIYYMLICCGVRIGRCEPHPVRWGVTSRMASCD